MEIAAVSYCSGNDKKGSTMHTQMHALKEHFNLRQVGSTVVEGVGAEGQLNMATVKWGQTSQMEDSKYLMLFAPGQSSRSRARRKENPDFSGPQAFLAHRGKGSAPSISKLQHPNSKVASFLQRRKERYHLYHDTHSLIKSAKHWETATRGSLLGAVLGTAVQ